MNGRKVSFITEAGSPLARMTLYFTFGYRGKNYAAFLDERGTFTFIDVRAVGDGQFQIVGDDDIDVKLVSKVMQSVLRAAKSNPKEYPVNGCHYSVRDVDMGDGRLGFAAERKKALDSDFAKGGAGLNDDSTISKIIKILIKACFCVLGILLFTLVFKDEWVSFFLPKFFHDKALLAYFIVETVAVVAVSLALKSFRKLGKFFVLALSTLFFFSGLGAMITNGSVLRCTMTISILAAICIYLYGLYVVTEFRRTPSPNELVLPVKAAISTLVLTLVISSNAVALMLGVEAPLPKITEKEVSDIESSYTASLGTVHPDSWRITDEKSRVKVLQGLTDRVCATELGCFVPTVELCEQGTDNGGQIARYSNKDKKIYIDRESLQNSEVSEVIKATLIECRLAWQYYIDGMYDSISDTVDKAYLGLETFKAAVEVNRDFADGDIYGGYAEKDRNEWTQEKYTRDIERYVLYRNGIVVEPPAAPEAPENLEDAENNETATDTE